MKKEENKFHQEYLQGKRDDQYCASGKMFFWLLVFYTIIGALYVIIKALIGLFSSNI